MTCCDLLCKSGMGSGVTRRVTAGVGRPTSKQLVCSVIILFRGKSAKSVDMFNAIISLVTGLLGGVIVTIVSHFLTRKKTAAEVKKIEAETEKIRAETRAIVSKVESLYESIGQQMPLEPQRLYFADKPVKISASRKNLFSIPSDFLQWEKCAVVLWVNVPPKGQGVRNTDSNRYIIAHMTEVANKEQGWPFYDRF